MVMHQRGRQEPDAREPPPERARPTLSFCFVTPLETRPRERPHSHVRF